MRLFVAITPPREFLSALTKVQRAIQRKYERLLPQESTDENAAAVRWTPEAQLHLTLLFITSFPRDRIDALCETVAKTAAGCPPFQLGLAAPKLHPPRRPRVVWLPASASASSSLAHLHRQLHLGHRQISGHSSTPESIRPYAPHLTLGRIHKHARRRESREIERCLADPSFSLPIPTWPVAGIELVESKPAGEIREYRILDTFLLGEPTSHPNS